MSGFFFARVIQDYSHLQGYLKERYSYAFKGGGRKKKNVLSYAQEVNDYINYINYINSIVCDGRQADIKILEQMSVDEYYATINNFLRIAEEKKQIS